MYQIKTFHFSYILLLVLLFLGCDSSYKEEKKSYLTLRNAHNSSLVPTNAYLYLDFSKDIDASTVTSDTFYLLDNNGTKIDGVLQIQLNRVTFLPTHYLNPLHQYSLVVTKDLLSSEGHGLFKRYLWNFQSLSHADKLSPELISKIPNSSASIYTEIALQFDEAIRVQDVSLPLLEVKDDANISILGSSVLEYDIIRFTPETPFSLTKNYHVTLNQTIYDLSSNEYNGTQKWSFSTLAEDKLDKLSLKELTSLETNESMLSMTLVDNILVSAHNNSINTYRINTLTCKLEALHHFETPKATYALGVNDTKSVLLAATSDGVHMLSLDTSGILAESLNSFYKTQAPVYDLCVKDNKAYLAQTKAGAQAIDISKPSNPIKLFDFPELTMATQMTLAPNSLYAYDASLQEIFEFTYDGSLINSFKSDGTVYDLHYKDASKELYMGMGLKGFATTTQTLFFPRSFINKSLSIEHQKSYTLLSDYNRGLVLFDSMGLVQSFISDKKGLFALEHYETCTYLGYETGLIQAVDIFAPFVASTNPLQNGIIEALNQSVIINFNEKIKDSSAIKENFIFSDDTGAEVPYSFHFDADKTVTLTPLSALHVKHHYSVHISNSEDLYKNITKEPFLLQFSIDYAENIAPQAYDDSTSMSEDTSKSIAILDNDIDINGDETIDKSSIVITSSPSHGSVSVTSSGIANYRPYANYYGNDSFAYTVKDTQGATSNVATVNILINDVYDPPPNQPPSANNDYAIYDNSANPPLYINVLANDTDINGNSDIDPSTVSIVATSGMATISVNPTTGIVSYTHNSYLTHPDTFEYTVKDYSGATSNPATVTVNYQ